MTRLPLVSVIIPTKNSVATIERCLTSVKDQTYSRIEVIVVDAFSRDGTRKVAESFGVKVFETGVGRSEARNIGAQKSRGQSVFFVDSDMELDSTVVDECVKKASRGFDGIIIPEVSVGEGFWARCKALEKSCYIGDDTIEAARFFRKNVFDRLGGYDTELEAGEDWDLNQRICKGGYPVGRIHSSIRHHDGKLTFRDAISKKHYYGTMIKRYRIKHPKNGRNQLNPVRLAFIRNWRKLAKEPISAIGVFLMKLAEFVALGIGGT